MLKVLCALIHHNKFLQETEKGHSNIKKSTISLKTASTKSMLYNPKMASQLPNAPAD